MRRYHLISQTLLVTAGGVIFLSLLLDVGTMLVDGKSSPGARSVFFLHMAMMFTLLIFAVVLRRWIMPHLLLPIEKIHEWAKKLENGNFNYKLPSVGTAEIDELVDALNRLASDIKQREIALRTMNAALDARSQELAELSRQTIAIQEEERRRVSRELHDGLSQVMGAAKMTLDIAAKLDNQPQKDELLAEASKTVGQAIDELHNISQGLRPTILDDLGLKEALEWYIQYFEERYHLSVEYSFSEIGALHLNAECEITAYRFLQEALTNVYKHAHSAKVSVKIRLQANYMMLSVMDDGAGFNQKEKPHNTNRLSLGLSGLQERLALVGGELIIHSNIGQGTTLIALLPMQGNHASF